MTHPLSTTPRVRRLPSVLLGVLAVLASFVAAPGPLAPAGSTAGATASAGLAAPQGTLRASHGTTRAALRRDLRQAPGAASRPAAGATAAQGPAPLIAVLPAAAVLAVLVTLGLAARPGRRRAPRRTTVAHRGRAPPATALA